MLAGFNAILVEECDCNFITFSRDAVDYGVRVELQFSAEYVGRAVNYRRIGKRTDGSVNAEYTDPHSQPVQSLSQFQADHARTKHDYRIRQILPVEYIIVDQHPVTCLF